MIYTYYGENSFLIQEKLAKIKESYEAKFKSGLNFFKFDLEENCDELKSSLESQSMFSEKKLVFLRGVLSVAEAKYKEIEDIINKNKFLNKSDKVILVLYDMLSSSAPPSPRLRRASKATEDRLKFFKTLGDVKEFKNFNKPQLIGWCLKKADESSIKISRADLAYLIDGIGCDTHKVWNEILKLSAYGSGKVERKNIDNMVVFDVISNSFKVTDALVQKKAGLALSELEKLWQNNEEPIMVLGAIVWQFRNMLKLADVTASNAAQVVQKFRLNPWVAQKTLAAVKNFSPAELKNIYQNLADIDLAIKTGERDGREALEDFVYNFLQT